MASDSDSTRKDILTHAINIDLGWIGGGFVAKIYFAEQRLRFKGPLYIFS